jgi:hypothetical protein
MESRASCILSMPSTIATSQSHFGFIFTQNNMPKDYEGENLGERVEHKVMSEEDKFMLYLFLLTFYYETYSLSRKVGSIVE